MFASSDEALNELRNERIRAPLIWGRVLKPTMPGDPTVGYRIVDLQECRFEEALLFIKAHHFNHEIILKAINFKQDERSVEEYLERLRVDMHDLSSIVCIDEITDRIYAVCVNRIMADADHGKMYNRVVEQLITTGEAYNKFLRFCEHLEKRGEIWKKSASSVYMKIRALTVKRKIPHTKIMYDHMLAANFRLAESLGCTAVAGFFTSTKQQELAQRFNMHMYHEEYYLRYTFENVLEFEYAESGNHGGKIYALNIPTKQPDTMYGMKVLPAKLKVHEEINPRKLKRLMRKLKGPVDVDSYLEDLLYEDLSIDTAFTRAERKKAKAKASAKLVASEADPNARCNL